MSFLIFSPTTRNSMLGAAALTLVSPALAQAVVTPPVIAPPVAAAPAPAVTSPVVAQPVPEQIVIVGHYQRLPDSVQSASQIVGFGDLDLSNPADRDILKHRIALTARYLCEKLGESDAGPGTCRDDATRDALHRVGTIEEHFAPRGTAWVRPPAWVPPYPQGWVTQYP